jgi:hypothetical protein
MLTHRQQKACRKRKLQKHQLRNQAATGIRLGRWTTPDPARWDAYLYVPDPDALAAEFASRNVEFSEPLKDTHDGLRGFELKDADGYVLFFGRPR